MKLKYILICLFVLFICSGCSVNYDLDIDKSLNLNESITVVADTNSEIEKIQNYNEFLPISIEADSPTVFNSKVDDVEYYDIVKEDDNSEITFDYSYNFDNFNDNVFARSCYQYVTVMNSYDEEEQRDELLISTSKKFLCFDSQEGLDNVTVRIKTKREVYSSNADSVDGNTYIWNITKDDKDDASIQMVVSSEIEDSLSFWEKNMLFLIAIGIFIVGGIVYIILKKHSDKVDEI